MTILAALCRLEIRSAIQNLPPPILHSWKALALLISKLNLVNYNLCDLMWPVNYSF